MEKSLMRESLGVYHIISRGTNALGSRKFASLNCKSCETGEVEAEAEAEAEAKAEENPALILSCCSNNLDTRY